MELPDSCPSKAAVTLALSCGGGRGAGRLGVLIRECAPSIVPLNEGVMRHNFPAASQLVCLSPAQRERSARVRPWSQLQSVSAWHPFKPRSKFNLRRRFPPLVGSLKPSFSLTLLSIGYSHTSGSLPDTQAEPVCRLTQTEHRLL